MKSTFEPIEGNKVKLSVSLDESEVEKALDETFRKIAQEVQIPGFRRGKAPRKILEARIGLEAARGEALQEVIPDYYVQAVQEHEVDIIDSPDIDITDGETDGPVVFEATVQVRPEISIGGYDSLRVTVPRLLPTSEEIDEQLERMRSAQATYETVERSAIDGDQVVIDMAGEIDGEPAPGLTAEDYSYEVGSGRLVEELDEALVGANTGDELSVTAAHPVQEGSELSLPIVVKEIRAKILPDLDDEFAAAASEFDSLEELRSDLESHSQRVRRSQAASAMRERLGEALADLVTDEIPEQLIQGEMQERIQDLSMRLQAQGLDLETFLQVQGVDQAQFMEDLRSGAEVAAKVDLALRAVAASEGLSPSEEDLDSEFAKAAEQMDQDIDAMRAQLESAGQLPAVRSDLKKRKAFDWLVEHVEIVDEEGNPVSREDLDEEGDTE